jgi:2-keto-4-pentenoate hydratase/2-oxohepta-3-ene-1,7-dioic acid hydratase in catechol pathway
VRLAFFDDFELGLVTGEGVVPVGDLVMQPRSPQERLVDFIDSFDERRQVLEERAWGPAEPLGEVRLRAPVPCPTQFLCATVNYREGPSGETAGIDQSEADFFLKSPLSVAGSGDVVSLPPVDARVFHHEAELGVVIGAPGRDIPRSEARSHVFGYTVVVDISARGVGNAYYKQKSQRGFGPVGPWIVTADEVPDPQRLAIRLWVNDELRQDFNTSDMLHPIDELIEVSSATSGLATGDLIATGTHHAGLGPLQDGDMVTVTIEGIGSLNFSVRDRLHRTWAASG